RNLAVPRLVTALMFLLAGLAGARFILYFVVWSLPLTCEALSRAGSAFLEREGAVQALGERLRAAVMEPAYPLAVLLAVGCVTAVRPMYFPGAIPVAAAEELAKHPRQGPLFCSEHAGSYLIFRFRGGIPVFIDTRADVYGREFCQQFREAILTGQNWTAITDRFHIQAALIPLRYQLAKDLEHSGRWSATYKDENYAIFERRSR